MSLIIPLALLDIAVLCTPHGSVPSFSVHGSVQTVHASANTYRTSCDCVRGGGASGEAGSLKRHHRVPAVDSVSSRRRPPSWSLCSSSAPPCLSSLKAEQADVRCPQLNQLHVPMDSEHHCSCYRGNASTTAASLWGTVETEALLVKSE